jgi:hypothetical protein
MPLRIKSHCDVGGVILSLIDAVIGRKMTQEISKALEEYL